MVYAINTLVREFHKLGATIQIETGHTDDTRPQPFTVSVRADHQGEKLFALTQRDEAVRFRVIDVDPTARYLLLQVSQRGARLEQVMYLCGRDGQGWFVTLLPARFDSIAQARAALDTPTN